MKYVGVQPGRMPGRRLLALLPLLLLVAALPVAGAEHVERSEVEWACGGFGSPRPGACGIEAIHAPVYTADAWVPDDDRVIGVRLGSEAKAFPTRMLDNHEIVTDTIGGVPVAVTWCPLCGSALVFERVVAIDGLNRLVQFDVSGYLYKHDLVMWEEETVTLWTQILGESIAVWHDGMSMSHPEAVLTVVPSELTTWGEWQRAHPGSLMLSNQGRNYGGSYAGYEDSCRIGISPETTCAIDNLHPKEFVIGIELEGSARAYPVFGVRQDGNVVLDELGGRSIVVAVTHAGGGVVYDAGGHSFRHDGEHWVDGTGRAWDLRDGRSLDGFEGLDLLDSLNLFWFAWRDHRPDTDLWLPEDTSMQRSTDPPRFLPAPVAIVLVPFLLWGIAVLRGRVDRKGGGSSGV